MKLYLNDLDVHISGVSHSVLGNLWKTEYFQKAYRILPHSRLYFPLDGYGTVTQDDKVYHLEKGKMLLIPAFARISVNCPEHLEKYWCHFNAFLGNSTLDLFFLHQNCIELEVEDFEFVSLLFQRLIDLGVQSDPVKQYEYHTGIKLLLARFLDHVAWSGSHEMLPVFIKLLLYINENLHKELSLKILSDQMGICRSHLSSIFHKKIGMRLSEYINMHRMYRAICLLRETRRSISEIGDECGFSNISVFSKAFKRHTGNSPGDFRKHFAQMPGDFYNTGL